MDTDLLIKNDTALKENVAQRKNILDESLIKSIRETDESFKSSFYDIYRDHSSVGTGFR